MSRLLLAPMEGLADCVLRDVLTRVGGYDLAVTEFVRVSGNLLPAKAFRSICTELANAGRTPAGTPVLVQLLGSDPACMAENAAQLAELAPAGIDINFGCPAPTVNRHGGGAVLLDDPELVGRIASVSPTPPTPSPAPARSMPPALRRLSSMRARATNRTGRRRTGSGWRASARRSACR